MAKPSKQAAPEPKTRKEILDALGKYQRAGFLEVDSEAVLNAAMKKETDRGLVIILGSITEDLLVACVLDEFKAVTKALEKELTRSGGALGTWAQLINLSLAFGFIDNDDASDLEVFKTMRNACAHSRQHIDFNTPELREAVSLWYQPTILRLPRNEGARLLFRRMFVHAAHYIQRRILGGAPKLTSVERWEQFMERMNNLPLASPRKQKSRPSKDANQGQQK